MAAKARTRAQNVVPERVRSIDPRLRERPHNFTKKSSVKIVENILTNQIDGAPGEIASGPTAPRPALRSGPPPRLARQRPTWPKTAKLSNRLVVCRRFEQLLRSVHPGCRNTFLWLSAPGRIASGPTAPRPALRSGPPPRLARQRPTWPKTAKLSNRSRCLSAVRTALFGSRSLGYRKISFAKKCARTDSNRRPPGSKPGALSS